MRLGIDFGTCFSSAAFLDGTNLSVVEDPFGKSLSIPSSIFVTQQNQILIGAEAQRVRPLDPNSYRDEIKRDLGRTEPLMLGKHLYLPEDLISAILRKLKQDADTFLQKKGKAVTTGAVLTIPTTHQQYKRDLMLKAAGQAGFVEAEVSFLEEPVAAAYYYARENKISEGEILLVYDLGGGTFDTTLLQKRGQGFEYLAPPSGLEHCGGVDFDRAIYSDLIHKNPALQDLLQGTRTDTAALGTRAKVREMCIELKHELSTQKEAEFSFVSTETGDLIAYSLTRSDFEKMIASAISETVTCYKQMLHHARITIEQVSSLLLVGGSCRIPYVQNTLREQFQCPLTIASDLELVVCKGAAHYTTIHKIATVSSSPGEADYTTISAALQQAEPGSRIVVRPGTYKEALVIDREVELIGGGPADQVILATTTGVGVQMAAKQATIGNLTIQNAEDEARTWYKHGAIVIAQGHLFIERCIIQAQGHGISLWGLGSEARIRGCFVQAGKNAGIAANNGAVCEIEDCTITGCRDAAIYVHDKGSSIHIQKSKIYNNINIGIVILSGGEARIQACEIFANEGSGVQVYHEGSKATISQCRIYEGNERGVLLWHGGQATMEDCEIFANLQAGIFVSGAESSLTLQKSKIYNGKYIGVDISNRGSATLEECEIYGNIGAGILVKESGSLINISRSHIHKGTYVGAVVQEKGYGIFSHTQIDYNGGPGILIRHAGGTIDKCDIQKNGVGVLIEDAGEAVVKDCILEKNRINSYIEPGSKLHSSLHQQTETAQFAHSSPVPEIVKPLSSFEPELLKPVHTLVGHTRQIYSVAISPYGQLCASGSYDETIRLWNLETGRHLQTFKGHDHNVSSIVISPDGKSLVSGSYDETIKVWDLQTGKLVRTLSGHIQRINAIAISSDGQILVSASHDNTLKLWNLHTGQCLRTFKDHTSYVMSVSISPDNQTILSGSRDQTIKLWDLNSGQLLHTYRKHTHEISAVITSLDGQIAISGSVDTTIKLWNMHTGQELRTLKGHTDSITSLATSSDRQTLLSGSLDQTIKLWNIYSGRLIHTLNNLPHNVRSVAISPNGQTILSSGGNTTVKIWEQRE